MECNFLYSLRRHFSISDVLVFRETVAYIWLFLFHFLVYFEKSINMQFLITCKLMGVDKTWA